MFPETEERQEKAHQAGFLFSSLTLSLENIIIVGILVGMGMILFYSLGVERGKKSLLADIGSDQRKGAVAAEAFEREVSVPPQVETRVTAPMEEKKISEKVLDVFEEQTIVLNDEGYTIQVASFKTEKYAKKEAMNIGNVGHEIFVMPKGDYSIVCVGKFDEKNKAEMVLTNLRKKYKDCRIRRF